MKNIYFLLCDYSGESRPVFRRKAGDNSTSNTFKLMLKALALILFALLLSAQMMSCQNSGHNFVNEPEPNKTASAPGREMVMYSDILDSLIDNNFFFNSSLQPKTLKRASSKSDGNNIGIDFDPKSKVQESETILGQHDTNTKYFFIHESLISLE